MAAYISHPEAYVQNFIQLVDIISWMGQNKNTLAAHNAVNHLRLFPLDIAKKYWHF